MLKIFGVLLFVLGLVQWGVAAYALWVLGEIALGVSLVGIGLVLVLGSFFLLRGIRLGGNPAAEPAGNYLPDATETRRIGDRSFEVHYQTPIRGKNGRPSKLTVRVPAVSPTKLQFHPETWFDRLGKSLGIAREVRTDDPAFDEAVYVRGLADQYAAEYLADATKRAGIAAILRSGFGEVQLTGTHVEAVWTGFDLAKNDRPGLAEDAAQALGILSDRLPAVELGYADPPDRSFVWWMILWAFLLVFAVSAIALWTHPPVRTASLFSAALPWVIGEYVGLVVVAGLLLRGTSVSHDRWGWIVGVGLLLVAAGGFGSFAAVNALMDNAPAEDRPTTIVEKRTSKSRKGGISYYASIPDWNRPNERIEFSVSAVEYARIVVNRSKLRLVVGPGRCGVAWLKEKAIEP